MTNSSKKANEIQISTCKKIKDREIILNYLKQFPDATNQDFLKLGIPEKTASGRISELLDDGVVYVSGTVKSYYGNYNLSTYRLEIDIHKVEQNRFLRREERFTKCVKAVLKFEERFSDELVNELNKFI